MADEVKDGVIDEGYCVDEEVRMRLHVEVL